MIKKIASSLTGALDAIRGYEKRVWNEMHLNSREACLEVLVGERVVAPLAYWRVQVAHRREQVDDELREAIERLAAEYAEAHQVRRVPARVEREQLLPQTRRARRRPQRLTTPCSKLAVVVLLRAQPLGQLVQPPLVHLRHKQVVSCTLDGFELSIGFVHWMK